MNGNMSLLESLKRIKAEQDMQKQQILGAFTQGLQQMYAFKVQEEQKLRTPVKEDITINEGVRTTVKSDVLGRPTYTKTEELEQKKPKENLISENKVWNEEKKGFDIKRTYSTGRIETEFTGVKPSKEDDHTKPTSFTPAQQKLIKQVEEGKITRADFLVKMIGAKAELNDVRTIAMHFLPKEKKKEMTTKEKGEMRGYSNIVKEYKETEKGIEHNNKLLDKEEKVDADLINRYYEAKDKYNGYLILQQIIDEMKQPENIKAKSTGGIY